MPLRLSLLFVLAFASLLAAQQQSILVVPDVTSITDASAIPKTDDPAMLQIDFTETNAEASLHLAQKLSEKGYRILLRFPEDPTSKLAQSMPRIVLAVGSHSAGCIIGDPKRPLNPERAFQDPARFSFLVKSLAIACREGNHDAQVYLAFLDPGGLKKMFSIAPDNSLFAYIDGYVAAPPNVTDFRQQVLQNHPSAVVLSQEPPVSDGTPLLTNLFAAFRENRTALIVPADDAALQVLFRFQKIISLNAVPEGPSARGPQFLDEGGTVKDSLLVSSFSDIEKRMAYLALQPRAVQPGYLLILSEDVDTPLLHDIVGETDYPLKVTTAAGGGASYIALPGLKRPMLLTYKRFSRERLETNEVTGEFELPLEIILARVQAVENRQKELLQHYMADARVEYHFRLPGGLAIVDVAYDDDFFFEPATGQEWRQKKMYVNGVPWKGKKIPQLPIPEPEKVVSVPLNLTLDKNYNYKLEGSDVIAGRDAWRIAFEPADEGRSLYRGRVWIDKQTFERLRVSTTQTNLEPPITSNAETLDFAIVEEPGQSYNLISSSSSQQIFSAGGRQVFAERSIRFSNIAVNSDGFEASRNNAYQSHDVMLRDTAEGLRYLKKDDAGNRVVEMEPNTRRKFWVFGGFYDRSTPFPIPFGGVNLLNYDWHKNGTQLNLLIAGALNVISISDPDFGSKNSDARLETALFTVPLLDPFYIEGVADKSQDLRLFREFGNAAAGLRLGEYAKITAGLQFASFFYLRTSDTSPDFELPSNHLDVGPLLELNYTRKGVALSSNFSAHYRSNWNAWGLPGSSDRLDPKKNYWQAQFGASKTFYPAELHKLGFSFSYLTGKNLDRFSTYTFFYLGDVSLAGYSGSGIRFDEGALLKSFYQFDFLGLIRLGGRVEYGVVRPLETDRWDNHVGIATDGTVFGPWDSLVSYDIGFSAFSDVPAVRHKFTISLMLLKLF